MYELVAVILWSVIALSLFQTYLGIYISLFLFIRLLRIKPPLSYSDTPLPTVTALIPAHNEEAIIAQRIENLLLQDYPPELFDIVVVSDVSTDRTVEIVRAISDKNSRVSIIEMTERHGKLGIIDEVAPKVSGQIVMITDANVKCSKDSVRKMAQYYGDPKVGAVAGNLVLKSPDGGKNVELETVYRRYEIAIKRFTSYFGAVIGVYGGFYSLRRELIRPIVTDGDPGQDDIILPMEVIGQWYSVVFAEDAIATEETTPTIKGEYARRIRMTGYNLNSLSRTIMTAGKAGIMPLYIAISYKVIRWLSPFLLLLFYLLSILLSFTIPIFTVVSISFSIGIAIALIGALLNRLGVDVKPIKAVYHFSMMNLASFIGLFRWMRGVKRYWTPRNI